jgi:hypothetical protein
MFMITITLTSLSTVLVLLVMLAILRITRSAIIKMFLMFLSQPTVRVKREESRTNLVNLKLLLQSKTLL